MRVLQTFYEGAFGELVYVHAFLFKEMPNSRMSVTTELQGICLSRHCHIVCLPITLLPAEPKC